MPEKKDLIKSAEGICSSDKFASTKMLAAIRQLTEGYQAIHRRQEREYFGLRDFYTVVKMVFSVAINQNAEPSQEDIKLAVQRNFGGYFGDFDPAEEFLKAVGMTLNSDERLPAKELILDALKFDKIEAR